MATILYSEEFIGRGSIAWLCNKEMDRRKTIRHRLGLEQLGPEISFGNPSLGLLIELKWLKD